MLQQIGVGQLADPNAHREGPIGGGDPVALEDQFIQQRRIQPSCCDGSALGPWQRGCGARGWWHHAHGWPALTVRWTGG